MQRIAKFVEGLVECRDPDLSSHQIRLGHYAGRFAKHLGFAPKEVDTFRLASEIHDIGKLAIPEQTLHKPSRLTRAERGLIEQHTTIGHDILSPLGLKSQVTDTVLHHHENFDGSGYPGGLDGRSIPEFARMLRICDSFDAVTMDRPYHRGVAVPEALEALQREPGWYDPELLDEFCAMVGQDLQY